MEANRGKGAICFLDLRDGTGKTQIFLKLDNVGEESLDLVQRMTRESTLQFTGTVSEKRPPKLKEGETPPPPARPSVPVASEDEFFDDDITIEDTDFDDFDDWGAPPPQDAPKFRFIPFDKPPKQRVPIRPIYPDIAQEAGIEGTVYVQFFIDIKGNVSQVVITKGMPNTGLDEAAVTAVKRSKWYPAQQRDKKLVFTKPFPLFSH